MDKLVITGGKRLRGTVRISGSKNAVLPIMCAALMVEGEVVLDNVPRLSDVEQLCLILEKLGLRTRRHANQLFLEVHDRGPTTADYEDVRKMRASVCVLGPLLTQRGRTRVSLPGGCNIGDRPIDLHLRGLASLGAEIKLEGGYIHAETPGRGKHRLRGGDVFLGGPFGSSVTATANILMAAVLAEGRTVIESAACEPEVVDLADFLNASGAKITGQGSPRILIEGVESLSGERYSVIPDRIEGGTFMVAAAITNGEIKLTDCREDHLVAVIDRLRRIGVHVDPADGGCVVSSSRRLAPAAVVTQPYPGFPTDLQAQFMALLALAEGNSFVTEKIFPDRFMHVAELGRLGAKLRKEGPTVLVEGVKKLTGAPVMCSDLRASAALVLAALAAEGESEVRRIYHLDRGYERIEQKLIPLGADIHRVSE